MTLALREAGAADLPAMNAIMADAFDATYGEAWTPAQSQGVFDLPGVWLSLAERDGAAIGFALGRVTLDEAELLLLAVRRACRRGGVGAALVAHTAAVARARGARRLHLEVRDGNMAAMLYAGAGFVRVGRRPAYYRGDGGRMFDAISLARTLD